MLLSIIIPLYNAEAYIAGCLVSILGQGISPEFYEIIVVNDGSKDGSCEIVERYQSEHSNIRLFSQENRGQSAARNVGIANARGEYIQFVDADDFLLPGSLSQVVSFARNEGAGPDMITFGISFGVVSDSFKVRPGLGGCTFRGSGYDYIATYNYNNSPCYYWLKSRYVRDKNLHFEEGKLCEDGMFTLTALLDAKELAHVDANVYFYAFREDSTITTANAERVQRLLSGYEYTIAYFGKMIDLHGDMPSGCRMRVMNRRDSYVFFLLARLLKLGLYEKAKMLTKELKAKGVYPLRCFPGKDYDIAKFKVFTAVMNRRSVFLGLCKLSGLRSRK